MNGLEKKFDQQQFDINDLLKKTVKKLEVKKTDHFIQLYQKGINKQADQFNIDKTDYELECQGYGLFRPDQILKEFFSYLQRFVTFVQDNNKVVIHSIKIHLNGFNFDKKTKYLETLAAYIGEISLNITTLWIYTADLENVTLQEYKKLFLLMNGLGRQNNQNFQNFILQCANWKFQSSQPTFKQLDNIFTNIFSGKLDKHGKKQDLCDSLKQKYVRIEISGWWYQEQEALTFLGIQNEFNSIDKQNKEDRKNILTKSVNIFHNRMSIFTSNLLEIMDNIETLQIDMRNNHQYLQMKKLKQKILCGVTKNGRQEKSLISIRAGKNNKQQESKRLRLSIVM